MSKQDKLGDAGDHLVYEVRALLNYVKPVLMERQLGQWHPGQMSEEKCARFDRVAKAERLLLVVDPQVGQALHQLWDLCVVCGSLYNLQQYHLFSTASLLR